MAEIKVFLPTYRRNTTLKRSIDSLLKQTFTDWRCEVHNDDPNDIFPGEYIKQLNDNRFTVFDHEINYGGVKTFNLAFENCTENYMSILEDDNWWEPDFLKTMYTILNKYPQVQMAWANMKLWQEHPGDKWIDLDQTIWPITDQEITLYQAPVYKQAFAALHSNGAMLVRNTELHKLILPENVRLDFVEPIRERIYKYPFLRVEKPLANFSITINTGRDNSLNGIFEHYLLLIDSFFKNFGHHQNDIENIWKDARRGPIKSFNKLLYTGLICKTSRILLKQATLKEWSYFVLYNIKHPTIFFKCLKANKTYSELWDILLTAAPKNTSANV
jgi:glycosyltransferase involved in cell wall biosynthesis